MKLKDLAWGAFLFSKHTQLDSYYQRLISNRDFLIRLVQEPSLDDFHTLREFLVNYGIPWAPRDLHEQYFQVWPKIRPHIQQIVGERIEICELNRISDDIEKIYSYLQWPYVWGGDTSASKVLHFFNPALIVMWDDRIREKYDGGYLNFLQIMQINIKEVLGEFNSKFPTQQLCVFLSEMLGYETTRPLTKLLDDYNWMTVTQKWPETIPGWLLELFTG